MTEDEWDFTAQKAETAWTIAELCRKEGLTEGMKITLDLEFVPGDGANREALVRALAMFGYAVADETEGEDVQVQVPDIRFTLDDIWLHEERCSKIALARGFVPDGWGFWEP